MSFAIGFQRFIDSAVFSPLCYATSLVKAMKKPADVRKILVVKFWALGDSVVLLPTLQALKKQFPNAELHILAHPRNKTIFEGLTFIDKIVDFGAINILKLFRSYDICIDAEPALSVSAVIGNVASPYVVGFSHGARRHAYSETVEFNKKQHMVQNYLDLARKVGVKYDTKSLVPLAIPKSDQDVVSKFLKEQKIAKNDFVIGIAPGVAESVKYRMWPIEKVAAFADTVVKKHKAKIIFIDAKSNKELIEKIQGMMKEKSISAAGLFSVKQSAALLHHCDIVVSNDSGLMHIAAAEGVKTIGLFGPNTPTLWGPYGKNNIALIGKKAGCPYMDNTSKHLLPNQLTEDQLTCMDAISVKEVLDAVQKLK